jgi:redox-sensitive bicupin YhaK (pirin superfamily)
MIQVYPAESRHTNDHGWLKSNFSFSFADYYDPNNLEFGPLRVFNDDVVQPSKGFGAHPHREMEIVSVVLSGHLEHEDSMGNKAKTTFGGVQRMSAGTGVVHSEVNPSDTEPVEFLQLWFNPRVDGITPSYEQTSFDPGQMKNRLLPIVSHESSENVALIQQDLTMYLSELEVNQSLSFEQEEGRRIYVFVLEGSLTLQGETKLNRRDAARITEHSSLDIQSDTGAKFMLIDLP